MRVRLREGRGTPARKSGVPHSDEPIQEDCFSWVRKESEASMEAFTFCSPTKFVLQTDADLLCGKEAKQYTDRVLFVHYGDEFTYQSGLYDRVIQSLEREGITYFELPGVRPNPEADLVRRGIEIVKQEKVGLILAAGGGSVIDSAKAVAIGAMYEYDVWDFYCKKAVPQRALPVGVIMTLPATGSEASNGSVLKDNGISADVMSELLRPAFALMNPELTLRLPWRQTAFGIIDMFTHVLERYFSTSREAELTDHMAEGVMRAIVTDAEKLQRNPTDPNLRAEFMWASIVAHNGLLGVGRNQDWATHALAAQMSAEFNTVHGAALSVLYPVWASYVLDEGNLMRFAQFANRVFNVETDFYEPMRTAQKGISCLRQFFSSLGGPATMKDLGIESSERFHDMACNVCQFGDIGGLKQLNIADVEAIYRLALV